MHVSQANELIRATAAAIGPLDARASHAAAERQQSLTKPPGSLGRLEDLALRIAGIRGLARPRLDHRLVVIAAGDHGVAAQGVSAYPPEVTGQMVQNFLAGGAAINVLAAHAGARVLVVDAGVASETPEDPRLVRLRLGPGTADITRGPAMSRDHASLAVAAGINLVAEETRRAGLEIVGAGEMGIGNSTAAAAIIAAATGHPARAVTGRGTGIDDDRFETKVRAVEAALAVNRPDAQDGLDLLMKVGGYEIGMLAGVYLGAASLRVPAVIDGIISGAAALIAEAVAPEVRPYLLASHRSAEPGHAATLEHLRLEPLLDLGMRLGEGSGAALGISLCVAACRVLDEMSTFAEAGVSGSEDVVEPES
ncbi:MAG: nicotinate-nucleotide--dimethylbenzimidazole phosphoribosyltransferase [Chloroflexi bacterium]|nr:nicotinate-nucleotide--dimethylbenzimidazole phosphoribosyltransferase [Chloroflexota bacterium]